MEAKIDDYNTNYVQMDQNGLIKIVLCHCECEQCTHKLTNKEAIDFLTGKGVLVHIKNKNGDYEILTV